MKDCEKRFGMSKGDVSARLDGEGIEGDMKVTMMKTLLAQMSKDRDGYVDLPKGEETEVGCLQIEPTELGFPTINVLVDETGEKIAITCASYIDGRCAMNAGKPCGQLNFGDETTVGPINFKKA